MNILLVIAAGPLVSVQDGGRRGGQRYGLPPSGAMDMFSLAIANTLVGNDAFTPALEIGPYGATFTANNAPLSIALAGAYRDCFVVDDTNHTARADMNCSFALASEHRLVIGPAREGLFSYLAMSGGIDATPFYGSLSVNARAGIGSPYPRMLIAGDRLSIKPSSKNISEVCFPKTLRERSAPIRVVLGPQDHSFRADALASLEQEWTLTPQCDRMGYQLTGPKLVHDGGHNIVSDGTVNGSIQVPANGAPIVLMPDRGTTGGYPKIATVITADLGRFAQTMPGQCVRFMPVTMDEAQDVLRDFHHSIQRLPHSLSHARVEPHDLTQALAGANVAGNAVNALDDDTWQHSGDNDKGSA